MENPNQKNSPKLIDAWETRQFQRQSTQGKLAQGSIAWGVYTIDSRTGTVRFFNIGLSGNGDIGEIVNQLYKK
jgi:hypothetical protein